MANFAVPTREEVSAENQAIFDNLNKGVGFVPNLYATIAYSDTGLGRFLAFQNGKTSLNNKEKEAVNLVVSQVNDCRYCQAAHTALGKMNGFTDEQIISLRKGEADWDAKLDALVKLAKEATEGRGTVSDATVDAFLAAGYDKGGLVDVVLNVADKTAMNYLHKITDVPIDFPEAPAL